jgi:uncharacterized membrane protein YdjX (TVP38/TMEM64 family)
MQAPQWKWVKFGILCAVFGTGVGVLYALGIRWSDVSPQRLRGYLLSFGWWAPAAYFLMYAQPVVPMPITIMAMAGGLAFGPWWAIPLLWVSSTIRACGQFLLVKVCGREVIESFLHGRLKALDESISRNGISTVFWIRIIPNVPFDLQNLSLGCSKVPFIAFAIGTFLGLTPAVVLWVYAGHTLANPKQLWRVAAIIIGIALFAYVRRSPRVRQADPQKSL